MGMLSSVGVVLHPSRAPQRAITTLMDWATGQRLPVYGLEQEVGRLDCAAVPVRDHELAVKSSLLVSLGGDGTMLRTLRLAHAAGTPVLGVNNGRLGFLAEVDLDDLPGAMSDSDAHAFTLEPRSSVTCDRLGGAAVAYNDIALVRVPGDGVAAVEVVVDGEPFVATRRTPSWWRRRRGRPPTPTRPVVRSCRRSCKACSWSPRLRTRRSTGR